MIIRYGMQKSDELRLSWWDILKLVLGFKLTGKGINVKRGKRLPPR